MSKRPPPPRNAKDPTPVDKYVGVRIRIARLDLGWTQEKAAAQCQVSPRMFTNYENGSVRMSIDRLLQLGRGLGVSGEWLISGLPGSTGAPGAGEPNVGALLTPDAVEMLVIYRQLSQIARERWSSLMRELVPRDQAAVEEAKRRSRDVKEAWQEHVDQFAADVEEADRLQRKVGLIPRRGRPKRVLA